MSLQVWLPLNGDLTNNGIANATISGSNIIYDTGLMGKAKTTGEVIIDKNYQGIVGSMAMWIYTSPNGDTTRIFGNDSSGTKNRKWTIHRYPTRNDLHSWGCCEDSNTTNPGSSGSFTITGALPDNKWTHIVYAHNATNGYIYVNGELRYTTSWSSTGKVYTFSDPVPLLSENGGNKICDFRLYDHCLSEKEVKELAKGLVLHYRLAGPGQPNLVKDSNKKIISGDYAVTSYKLSENLVLNQIYTITMKAKLTPDLKWIGIWSDGGNTNFADCQARNKNNFYKWTVTCNSFNATHNIFTIFASNNNVGVMQGNTPKTGTCEIEWIKLEKGSVATPWCPNPADALYNTMGYNNNIEYDCSGYCHNGTKSGSIAWDVDSPRYTTSYNFSKSGYIYNNSFGVTTKEYTISLWVKLKPATSQHFLLGTFDSWTGNGIGFYRDANQLGLNCVFKSNGESSWGSLGTGGLSANTWYMVTYTSDGTIIKRYLNGIYKNSLTYGKGGNTLNPVFYIANSKFNGTPASENEEAFISDVRFYATALSAEDIAELYHSAVIVDNTGKTYAYEYFET